MIRYPAMSDHGHFVPVIAHCGTTLSVRRGPVPVIAHCGMTLSVGRGPSARDRSFQDPVRYNLFMDSLRDMRAAVIDMDGVLWEGDRPLPGLVEFFAGLRQRQIR